MTFDITVLKVYIRDNDALLWHDMTFFLGNTENDESLQCCFS